MSAHTGAVHDWHTFRHFNGWAEAQSILDDLAMSQCNGGALLVGTTSNNKDFVVYLYTCAFLHTHGCKWCCRVKLMKNQDRDDPVVVGLERRSDVHARHAGWVETNMSQHVDHRGPQLNTTGGCQLFMVTACR